MSDYSALHGLLAELHAKAKGMVFHLSFSSPKSQWHLHSIEYPNIPRVVPGTAAADPETCVRLAIELWDNRSPAKPFLFNSVEEFPIDCNAHTDETPWRSMDSAPKDVKIIAKGWHVRWMGGIAQRDGFDVVLAFWDEGWCCDRGPDYDSNFEPIGWLPWPTAEEPK